MMRRYTQQSIRKRPTLVAAGAFAAAVLMLASALLQPLQVSANMFDNWENGDGGWISEGYFSNNGASDMNAANRRNCAYPDYLSRCPVLPNGDYAWEAINGDYFRGGNASTAASIERAHNLVNDLKARYDDGAWEQAGTAFIVNTMLGYTINDGRKTRSVSTAMWNDLEARLVERASRDRIDWNIDFSSNEKDTYVRQLLNADGVWRHDVVYDGTTMTRNGIIIYNDDWSQAYRIWYLCANPVGDMTGLPPLDFTLTPTITGTPSQTAGETPVSLTPIVNNGGTTGSSPAQWQITTFKLDPGVGVPGGGLSATTPVPFYGNGASVIASGSQAFNRGNNAIAVGSQTVGDYPVGTKVCYTLSVQPYKEDDARWNHSAPFCVTISKSPKVQILGNDLIVGRGVAAGSNVITSLTRKVDGTQYGSWSEYAIAPTGLVTGMASGSGYAGGTKPANLCGVSLLTFNNYTGSSCNSATIGKYAISSVAPRISARFPVSQNVPSNNVNLTGLVSSTSGTQVYGATAGVRLTVMAPTPIDGGHAIVINAPDTDVEINSDIIYASGPFSSARDIPQIVIIARNIIVAESVQRIDAWLIANGVNSSGVATPAEGRINTCGVGAAGSLNEAAGLNASVCRDRLVVNGPVIANHLVLRRTAGADSGTGAGNPAEIFNLRPDAYLWVTSYSSNASRIQTVNTKELPPRF